MLRFIKENPLASAVSILTIVAMLSSGVYSVYVMFEKLENFVTEQELDDKANELSIEVLNVSIMRYEDDLMRLEFKIEIGTATQEDRAEKLNIERRLGDLKQRKMALESGTGG
jgi:hypothetical protein